MVAVMVEQFRDMQRRLADTIAHYDTPEFKALDRRIAAVFNAIYHHDPRDADEACTIMRFFLDIIEDNGGGENDHLIDRVRSILDLCAGLYPPPMEITHGAGI